MLINLIDFMVLGDERGALIALESNNQIPFDMNRVYYLYGTKPGVARGFHAHKKLKQLAVCIKGSCRFVMDDGSNKQEVILSTPDKGLLIDAMQWHEMYDFSDDCVLLVLANQPYDESDYIRDYSKFIEAVNNDVYSSTQ
ncbi:sugar 3,4-ketoisomerase [Aeromonas caviae]|uniref:dTDP-6-deoxy-3,4-keto-hexulose isomerase n=1 Tax=Aeromonas caviae TaxID=648 RepID=A0AA37CWB2_AERCA|nr:FdtA/QdtA family cupin domain-containing protein [Aeromonas caviae]MDH0351907.1 FdtA/QdtA family cupin domain-containing protein [Aeromonas caviae]GJA18767.1 dTDP-6-deoxy-3,4-keto-hexulose isomerase [Aeromonas caviae]GJA27425.1 dTDP-6-deoxy-3,4-keto-hexulose isomerase [Aeromonas caviae]GJA63049.1 dTDP-6-deoxy-3,4-keto-hexulose isomerase [Aeromonas caviae]GJA74153.1 dTDP-6-deoxy-3,4-keto-hexulose isomerase [Aeromonas caviae]